MAYNKTGEREAEVVAVGERDVTGETRQLQQKGPGSGYVKYVIKLKG
jgi:hypothetical protein